MAEIWKQYPESEKYIISSNGKVKSLHGKKPKILKTRIDLFINKKRISWLLPDLIHYVFGNNRSHPGKQNSRAKLTENQVVIIRDIFKRGDGDKNNITFTYNEFLEYNGINKRTLEVLLEGKTWKHV